MSFNNAPQRNKNPMIPEVSVIIGFNQNFFCAMILIFVRASEAAVTNRRNLIVLCYAVGNKNALRKGRTGTQSNGTLRRVEQLYHNVPLI